MTHRILYAINIRHTHRERQAETAFIYDLDECNDTHLEGAYHFWPSVAVITLPAMCLTQSFQQTYTETATISSQRPESECYWGGWPAAKRPAGARGRRVPAGHAFLTSLKRPECDDLCADRLFSPIFCVFHLAVKVNTEDHSMLIAYGTSTWSGRKQIHHGCWPNRKTWRCV